MDLTPWVNVILPPLVTVGISHINIKIALTKEQANIVHLGTLIELNVKNIKELKENLEKMETKRAELGTDVKNLETDIKLAVASIRQLDDKLAPLAQVIPAQQIQLEKLNLVTEQLTRNVAVLTEHLTKL